MNEPTIEKWPHPLGIEYALVHGEKILGSVIPVGAAATDGKTPKRWKALVLHREVGIFSGKRGRLVAMRAVQHFAKHLWAGVRT
jgi:hypothetical protein